MTDPFGADAYIGRNAVDPHGDKIGSVGQVYLNDATGQPDWITVNTGLFGTKEHFAPLVGSSFNGDALVLPFDKNVVKDAPDVADASHLDVDEQEVLYAHYDIRTSHVDVSGVPDVAAGRARLRKFVVTGQQSVPGEVRKEQIEVDEDITPPNDDRRS